MIPNKLSRFWQELKRRNVVRVVTVYAGAAFVIIELINNITEPLRLPEWTPTLVIVLMAIGFPVVIIFSWIYDVHPEGGVVKTEPVDQVKEEETPKSSSGWKMASYISFVVIVGLIVLNVIPRIGKKEILDKSIAILPFINDSPDQERMYFINGTMEAILDNLAKIKDLRVVSRMSVEQYRGHPKPIAEVAEEMNVSYVLEGSGHRDGNNVRIHVQLLDGKKDQHLWSNTYQGDIEDIFSMLSEIAKEVSREIEAVITPEEMKLIEKVPTTNQTAYDLYQKALEEGRLYFSDPRKKERFEKAGELLRTALEFDPTFAMAYMRIAWGYWFENAFSGYTIPSYMDSAVHYVDLALTHDPELADAYLLKGLIWRFQGERDSSLMALDRVLQLNPNSGDAYRVKGWIYYDEGNHVEAIINFFKSIEHDRSKSNLIGVYNNLATDLSQMGFFELAETYIRERLTLNGDTISYYSRMAEIYQISGNCSEAIELASKGYEKSNRPDFLKIIGGCYFQEGRYKEALEYFVPYIETLEEYGTDDLWTKHVFAYSYLKNGFPEKAELFMEKQIAQSEEWIANDVGLANGQYIFLAYVYAMRNEKEKALENLRLANQQEGMTVYVMTHRNSPLFENIRDEPEFLQIVSDMEAKYQAEHERVRQWLEDNEML